MSPRVKNACLDRVITLHKAKVLHGDLRAPNFIVAEHSDTDEVNVFVIDFGRAKIFRNDDFDLIELEDEMEDFKNELKL